MADIRLAAAIIDGGYIEKLKSTGKKMNEMGNKRKKTISILTMEFNYNFFF